MEDYKIVNPYDKEAKKRKAKQRMRKVKLGKDSELTPEGYPMELLIKKFGSRAKALKESKKMNKREQARQMMTGDKKGGTRPMTVKEYDASEKARKAEGGMDKVIIYQQRAKKKAAKKKFKGKYNLRGAKSKPGTSRYLMDQINRKK